MSEQVRTEFGGLDIFVSNALVDLQSVAQSPMDVTTPSPCGLARRWPFVLYLRPWTRANAPPPQ